MDEEDETLEAPYRAEYSKSNRAKCKGCKTTIEKDVLRLASVVQSPFHDGKVPNWYHFMCFFGKQRPKSVGEIAHFDSLRWEDQEKIKKKLEEVSGSAPATTANGKKSKSSKKCVNPALKDFSVEYAKSSRAACRGCEIKIPKDDVRISKKDFESENARMYGGQDRWHHVDCFAKLRIELEFFDCGEELPGFHSLKKEDKDVVKKALPKINGSKTEDKVDGAPSEKKVKTEVKKEKENRSGSKKEKTAGSGTGSKKEMSKKGQEEGDVEELMKKQNKLMFDLRDELQELKKPEMVELLLYNNQFDPIGKDRKLDRLQDVMAFGCPLPCTVCKNGSLIYRSGLGYQCTGDMTEWTKCLHVEEKPERIEFKVPEKLKEKFAFLDSYKCKVQDRVFIKDVKIKKEEGEASTSTKIDRFAPFKDLSFFIMGKVGKSKLKKEIEQWGGSVPSKVTQDVTAVISTEEEIEDMNTNMLKVKNWNISVVPASYVKACESGNAIEKIKELRISPWGGNVEDIKKVVNKSVAKKSGKSKFLKSESKVTLKVVGGTAVDPDSKLEDVAHVYKDSKKNLWTSVLGLTDVQSNKNSFYKLQLLESNTTKDYWLFRSWGRIGTTIGGKIASKMDSLEAAKSEFKGVFLEKTGNHWRDRQDFVKKPNCYYPIDIDYGQDDALQLLSESTVPSKLAKPVQDLISMIFDTNIMKKVMLEFELDLEKMPLGKLSKAQIQKAYGVLSELQGRDGDIKPKMVVDATNRFYTLIPHDFGVTSPPLLDHKEIIQAKLEMLESLLEMEVAYGLLRETSEGEKDKNLHPYDSHYAKLNTDIQVLERDSKEFELIEKYVKNTHGETHTNYTLEIVDIFKVKRSGEDKRFKPFKKMHNKKLLWHGSRVTNFAGILSQGLRIAPPEAPVCGYMFGKGIYFADMVSKSANYCMTSSANPNGLLLLCEVALGDMYERTQADYIEKLPSGKHSTKGAGWTMPDPAESVQLDEGLEVPLGKPIKQFSDRSHTSLLYNEYIVYDVSQVKVQYLLKTKFNYVTY